MRSDERRDAHNQEVKRRILEAARELLLADGVAGFSMRKLGNKIGYTATGIYHHFPDKHSLLRALMDADFRTFRAALGQIGQVDDPIERIRRMGEAYVVFAQNYPDHYQILFMTPALEGEHSEIVKGDPSEDAYAFLRQAVSEVLQSGRFRPEMRDADEIAQIIWAGVHGLVSLHIAKGKDEWIDWHPLAATFQRLNDALLRGLTLPSQEDLRS